MNPDYDKVIEFFSEHETAIYGLAPTDDGAEEGTLLWCIKELDDIYNRSKGIVLADRGITLKNQILNVLCTLMDIYENSSNDGSYTYYEIWNTTSERTSECTERCFTIETAKEHLASHHCDWCRPAGTGRIYGVNLVPTEDGSITMVRTTAYENK